MVTPLFENRSEYIKIFQSANLSPTVHFHKSIELIYVIEGGGIAYADQKKYTVKTGDVFISFPNQIHYYLYSATGKYLIAIFSPDILFEMREQLYNSKLGMNFNNYLNSIRINHACDLLNESNKKIADISEETGFGSIRSFNRAFKSVMNMTPAEYRNNGAK